MSDVVARRWAKALHELSVSADAEAAVLGDLQGLADTCTGSEGAELFAALSSPVFTTEERKAVLGAVLANADANALTRNFLDMLIDRDRFSVLPAIAKAFTGMSDERAGRVRVQVSTVDPLSPQLEEELKAAFAKATGKEVLLEATLDPSLIGGLVARAGSRVYDASLRTRLEDLKNRLIYAQAVPEA